MNVCFPLVYVLRRFRCPSRKRRTGKRPETFLTPYEMEMVPLMLKELRQINPRFFETVSFRWFKEAVGTTTKDHSCSNSPKSESLPTNSLHIHPPATMHEFENEGIALEELINNVARTLMNNGTFDEDCEQQIAAYRRKREQWRAINSVIAASAATLAAPSLLRSRSFSAAVAAPPITTSRFCGNFCADENKLNARSLPKRLSRLTTKKNQAMSKMRQTDMLFVQLGEVLVYQFQCTVGVDKDGSVHERELKLLIWRHFVQMLVAILTDRVRFPYKPNQAY